MPLHTARQPVTNCRCSWLILPSPRDFCAVSCLPCCKSSIKNYHVFVAKTQQEAILIHVGYFYISVWLMVVLENSTTLFLWSDSKGHIETHGLSNTCAATLWIFGPPFNNGDTQIISSSFVVLQGFWSVLTSPHHGQKNTPVLYAPTPPLLFYRYVCVG